MTAVIKIVWVGYAALLALGVGAKLVGLIDVSWWVALSPLWIPILMSAALRIGQLVASRPM